jgi:hypothetical protein
MAGDILMGGSRTPLLMFERACPYSIPAHRLMFWIIQN